MPPVVVASIGFLLMLAFLVLVHHFVRNITSRVLGARDRTARLSRRLLATAAGPLASYLVCALFFLVAIVGFGRPEATLRVSVTPSGPAYEAGLRDGDRLLTPSGTVLKSWTEVPAMVQDNGGRPIDIQVERGGQTLHFTIQPRDARIGVSAIIERHELPLGVAAGAAIVSPVLSISIQLHELTERLTERGTLMGPVAIIVHKPSPWTPLFRLGELGSYAWPFSILIAFAMSRAGALARPTPGLG
jgi:membrane-associated protease RseP (regulator of RpoE activity)